MPYSCQGRRQQHMVCIYVTYRPISEQPVLIVLHHMLHHLLRSNTEVCRPRLVSVIGSFRTARLPGQATRAADPLRVSVSNNPTIDQNIIPGLPGSGTTSSMCVVWLVFGGEAVIQRRALCTASLVPSLCVPPGEKQSGEQSRIYYPKVVRTNGIARSG